MTFNFLNQCALKHFFSFTVHRKDLRKGRFWFTTSREGLRFWIFISSPVNTQARTTPWILKKYQQPWTCRWYHHSGRKWRELKSLLMRVKRLEWKRWLKTYSKNKDHGISSQHFMAHRRGESEKLRQISFSSAPKSLWMVTAAMKLEDACSLEEKL